jgi:hypothetical protein
VLGTPMPTKPGTEAVSKNLADAAKHVGGFGEGTGSLAPSGKRLRALMPSLKASTEKL